MNPFRWSFRAQFLCGFFACVALLAYALYLEHYGGLVPCPLCTFQRGALCLARSGVLLLLGADSNLKCNTCYQVRFADVITSFVLVLSTTSA